MSDAPRTRNLWLRRVGWLALIWTGSVAALGGMALLLRLVMTMAGMTV